VLDSLITVRYIGIKYIFIILNLNRILGTAQKPVIFINFTFNSKNTRKSNIIQDKLNGKPGIISKRREYN